MDFAQSFSVAFVAAGYVAIVWLCMFALGSFTIALMRWTLLNPGWRSGTWGAWLTTQPFAFAALAIGYLAGLSHTPVFGTLLPAVLTLIGGLVASVLAPDRRTQLFAATAVPTVAAALVMGAAGGAALREARDEAVEGKLFTADQAALLRRRAEWLAELEEAVRTYRMSLGLPNSDEPMFDLPGVHKPSAPAKVR